ncbi:MAG: hypothetical protein ACXVHT_05430 [Methanobacterium sp.]
MLDYQVKIINPDEREEIYSQLTQKIRHQLKANIHGACIKLLTDNKDFKDEWEDNFKSMSDDIRPHAKIYALSNGDREMMVMYDPVEKSVFLINVDYYGWVKSIALAAVSDLFEDYHSNHRRYSVHGSAVDHQGQSIVLIGLSGVGKTSLTCGLLQNEDFNYISDDWFFVRLFSNSIVLYSSEKNPYIRDDVGDVLTKYKEEVRRVKLDNKGRGIANVYSMFDGRVRESSTLKSVILLERNNENPAFRKLNCYEALDYMLKADFCNPHQLIRDERKLKLRLNFFRELFSKTDVYILNTIETLEESLGRIENVIKRDDVGMKSTQTISKSKEALYP